MSVKPTLTIEVLSVKPTLTIEVSINSIMAAEIVVRTMTILLKPDGYEAGSVIFSLQQ